MNHLQIVLSAIAVVLLIVACDPSVERERLISAFSDAEVLPLREGAPAPAFRLPILTPADPGRADGGRNFAELNDYAGEVVVLYFWSSWCLACLDELPEILELATALRHRDVAVLPVLYRDTETAARKWFAREDIRPTLPMLLDYRGRVGDRYRILGVPHAVVVDREGRIAGTFFGRFAPIEDVVEGLLAAAGASNGHASPAGAVR